VPHSLIAAGDEDATVFEAGISIYAEKFWLITDDEFYEHITG